ncbi:Gfo/Idh/MocA family oxidoreductase [Streptomyces sp. NPDC052496]|uniref:Gfo/Idh/MocA family protein n=1 Tax=Streptomyces sp. NPDC052496 TaxID=3154951 RepID=UPI003436D62D
MPAHAPSAAPIGVGIIGLSANGGWAARAHLPALAAVPGYELRALSASTPESARAAGEKYGVPLAFGSAAELVRRDEVDLVVVSVKVPHHRELVLAALEAGKAVLSEWPLGNGLAETEELAAVAEARGLRTFVGLQARSAPPVRYVRDLIADGYVGDVLSTSLIASGRGWGPLSQPGGAYLLDRRNGASLLTIPFGHTVDALTMTLGEFTDLNATMATRRPKVRDAATGEPARMDVPDQIAVNGVLEGGAVASVHFRGGLSRATNFHWEINGTAGDLLITGDSGHLQFGQVTVHGARGEETELAELPVPNSYDAALPALAGRSTEMAYTVAHAYEQIRADLTDGTHHAPDFAHAVRSHRLLDRIERAAGF